MFMLFFRFIKNLLAVVVITTTLVIIYNEVYKILPTDYKKSISKFCADFDVFKFKTDSGAVYLGQACDFNHNAVLRGSCVTAIILDGTIGNEMLLAFEAAIQSDLIQNMPVCFRSHGGVASGSVKIAALIRQYNLDTCMSDYVEYKQRYHTGKNKFEDIAEKSYSDVYCASMCPFILIAGENRYALGDNFAIQLHHTGKRSVNCVNTFYENSDLTENNYYLDMVSQSAEKDKKQHYLLYQRALKTSFTSKKLDSLCHCDFEQYALFTQKPQTTSMAVQ